MADLLPRRRGLLAAPAVLAILALLILSGAGRSLEDRALDLALRLRPQRPPPDLLIVGIDEPSFKELHHPWPRRLHAALVDRLAGPGARLSIFD